MPMPFGMPYPQPLDPGEFLRMLQAGPNPMATPSPMPTPGAPQTLPNPFRGYSGAPSPIGPSMTPTPMGTPGLPGNPTVDIFRDVIGGGSSMGGQGMQTDPMMQMGQPAADPAVSMLTQMPPSPLDAAVQQGGMAAIKPTVDVMQKTIENLGPPSDFVGPPSLRRGTGKATEGGILLPAESQSTTASGSEGAFGESTQGLGDAALDFLKNAITLPISLGAAILKNPIGAPMNILQRTVGAAIRGGDPSWVGEAYNVRRMHEGSLLRQQGRAELTLAQLKSGDPEMYKAAQPLLAGPLRAIQQIGGESASGREGLSTLEGITTRHPWVGELFHSTYADEQKADINAAIDAKRRATELSDLITTIQTEPARRLEMMKLQGQAQQAAAKGEMTGPLMQSQIAENAAQAAAAGRSNMGGGGTASGVSGMLNEYKGQLLQDPEIGMAAARRSLLGDETPTQRAANPWLDAERIMKTKSLVEGMSPADAREYVSGAGIPGRVEEVPGYLWGSSSKFIPEAQAPAATAESVGDTAIEDMDEAQLKKAYLAAPPGPRKKAIEAIARGNGWIK